MAMWAITQTDMFRASVCPAPQTFQLGVRSNITVSKLNCFITRTKGMALSSLRISVM